MPSSGQRWFLVLALAAGLLLSSDRLLGVVGYESAAVMGVVLGLLSAARGLAYWHGRPGPLGMDPDGPVGSWLDRAPSHLVLVLPPVLALGLAEQVRGACDPGEGLAFWLWIPVPAVLFGQALAWGAASLAQRTGVRAGLVLMWVLADVGVFVARLALEPPIQGHSWLFGWFAGSFYDQALSFPDSLVQHRVLVGMWAASALGLLELAWRSGTGRPLRRALGVTLTLLALSTALHLSRSERGLAIDRADIAAALGGELVTEHFVIHYEHGRYTAGELRQLGDDHEYRYDEMRRKLGTDPVAWRGRPIHSFVYSSARSQYELFGSRNTFVARPWTHEMHLRWTELGDTGLAHELSHLFSAEFGRGPLKLATRGCGLCVDLAMVEGLATAADWPPSELTPHQVTAALRRQGQAPDLRGVFGLSGFWSQPSGKVYVMVGSFVRWLWDTHGIAPLREVYGDGDYRAAYGVGVESLIGDWEAWVDTLPLTEDQLALAAYRYDRGGLFQRACARTKAGLEREQGLASRRGDAPEALALAETLLAYEPDNPEYRVLRAEALAQDERLDEARAGLEALLELDLSLAWQGRTWELLGDLSWRQGALEQADEAYARTLSLGLPDARRRVVLFKRAGLADPRVQETAYLYLVPEETERLRSLLAREWALSAPEDPLPRYLVGLQLAAAERHDSAAEWFAGPEGLIAEPALDAERRWRWARSLVLAGRASEARGPLTSLLDHEGSRLREEALQELDRVVFLEE